MPALLPAEGGGTMTGAGEISAVQNGLGDPALYICLDDRDGIADRLAGFERIVLRCSSEERSYAPGEIVALLDAIKGARDVPETAVSATPDPDPDELHPIEGFVRNEIYRESMLERDGIISALHGLVSGLLDAVRLGAASGEGLDREWCRELHDGYSARLRELGFEEES